MKRLRSCGAVMLVLFLGMVAVAVLIAAAWGTVVFIQRGAGTHLEEPTPAQTLEEESASPAAPEVSGAP